MSAQRLAGKTALITGGTSGIGLAVARTFLSEGARVIVSGRTEASLAMALADLPGARGVVGDVDRVEDINRVMAFARAEFGGLDLLVLSAGVSRAAPLAEVSEADFDAVYGVNVKGLFFCVQKAQPLLKAGGSIVLIGSGATELGRVGKGLYASSKAAVRQLGRSLAAEMIAESVRVNVVSPGPILTPMSRAAGRSDAEQAVVLGKMVPIGRVGQPQDVANAVLFLASDESSFITGAELPVDGGWVQLHEVPKPPATA